MLVQLNRQGSFEVEEVNNNLVVVVGSSKYLVKYDSKDVPYIGFKGNKVLVNWL